MSEYKISCVWVDVWVVCIYGGILEIMKEIIGWMF